MLLSLEIQAPTKGLPLHFQVGRPISSVIAVLGEPEKKSGRSLEYSTAADGEYSSSVEFRVAKGRITSIRWSWDID